MRDDFFDFDMNFDEFIALEKLLEELPRAMQARVLNNASAAGARVVRKYWAASGPAAIFKDRNNIKILTGKRAAKKTGADFDAAVGTSLISYKNIGVNDRFTLPALASVFEYGSVDRFTKETGAARGKMTPKPWMRPAMDSSASEVNSKMALNMSKGLAREAEKARARGV